MLSIRAQAEGTVIPSARYQKPCTKSPRMEITLARRPDISLIHQPALHEFRPRATVRIGEMTETTTHVRQRHRETIRRRAFRAFLTQAEPHR